MTNGILGIKLVLLPSSIAIYFVLKFLVTKSNLKKVVGLLYRERTSDLHSAQHELH